MTPRRAGETIDGWLAVDKPPGMTSAAVVGVVRRATRARKVGHGGTLDPMATGILPLAFGEATKTVAYVMDRLKTYRFTVRWGERRDTDDAEGKVIDQSDRRPGADEIAAVLPRFVGEIDQVPPPFSAIKVQGRRAYELARNEIPVELPPRRVVIERIVLIDVPDRHHAVFEVRAGKGTYVRALARDVAAALNTVGYLATLRRLAVGSFTEANSIPLDNAVALGHSGDIAKHLLSVDAALDDIPALALTEAEAQRLRHGQPVAVLTVAGRSNLQPEAMNAVVRATAGGTLVALARITGGEIRPLRVLNL